MEKNSENLLSSDAQKCLEMVERYVAAYYKLCNRRLETVATMSVLLIVHLLIAILFIIGVEGSPGISLFIVVLIVVLFISIGGYRIYSYHSKWLKAKNNSDPSKIIKHYNSKRNSYSYSFIILVTSLILVISFVPMLIGENIVGALFTVGASIFTLYKIYTYTNLIDFLTIRDQLPKELMPPIVEMGGEAISKFKDIKKIIGSFDVNEHDDFNALIDIFGD